MISNVQCKSDANRGFTLIELLVVISIIAVLMSIMMPALRKAKDQASRITCSANLKQMGVATGVYLNEHRYLWHDFVVGDRTSSNFPGSINYLIYDGQRFNRASNPPFPGGRWVNHGKLFEMGYIGTAKAFYCPSDDKRGTMSYDYYFNGDKLKSTIEERAFARGNYLARNFNMIKGNPTRYRAVWDDPVTKYPKMQLNENIAILSDRWTLANLPVHGKRYLNSLFGDGRVVAYDDKEQNVVALGNTSTEIDAAQRQQISKSSADAMNDAVSKFGNVAKDLQWAAGWLYLDTSK